MWVLEKGVKPFIATYTIDLLKSVVPFIRHGEPSEDPQGLIGYRPAGAMMKLSGAEIPLIGRFPKFTLDDLPKDTPSLQIVYRGHA